MVTRETYRKQMNSKVPNGKIWCPRCRKECEVVDHYTIVCKTCCDNIDLREIKK